MSARHLRNMPVKEHPTDHGYGDPDRLDREERRLKYDMYMLGWAEGCSGDRERGHSGDPEGGNLAFDLDTNDPQVQAAYRTGYKIGAAARAKAMQAAAMLFGHNPAKVTG